MSAERQPGDVLDQRYRLVERLGQGGFGDVWRAEELLPDGKPLREVALKLLRGSVAADWTEEARIIASLRHPALVTIYAAGLVHDSGGLPFVAMELLIGETLAAFVERGERVAWRRVLAWAREAAAALDEIHRARVVHLDLKPANLFLTSGGTLKVLDFGIAQQGRARAEVEVSSDEGMATAAFMAQETPRSRLLGATGTSSLRSVVGTPGFMAPEVLEGGEPSAASDAYALAACVVQLVTGRLPQGAAERPNREDRTAMQAWLGEVQNATVHGRLRDLSRERLPAGLCDLVVRWLRLDPMARGVEQGTLRGQLDEVWLRPYGAASSPFPGLAHYRYDDEGNLNGRATEIDRLTRELVHQAGLVLYGAAGAGLTSLVLAGVVPALGCAAADGLDDWRACHLRLGDDPDASFEADLDRWLGSHGSPASTLSATPADPPSAPDDDALLERLRALARKSRLGLVLVIEDLPAAIDNPARSRQVVEAIAALSANSRGLRFVALMREERAAEVLASDWGKPLQPWTRYVGLPAWTAAEELVERPARAAGALIDGASAITSDVKAELGRDGASLAALSLALSAWWHGPLTAARWAKQGGVVGPLADHAERVLSSFDAERALVAEWILVRMVRADGSGVEVEARQLLGASDDSRRVADVLAELVDQRVVAVRAGKLRLAHPELAHRWTRLHDRRLHDLERLSFLEELRDAAQRWKSAGRSASELWGGGRLHELERRHAGLAAELGMEERAFIEASAARRRRGRMMRGLGGTVLVCLLALVLGVDAARRNRAEAQQRALEAANRDAAIAYMVTLSRRTTDPYHRIALVTAAIEAGSPDPLLPIELWSSARSLPPARFLTLAPLKTPRFPWDERYLLAASRAHAVVFDFEPDEGMAWGPTDFRLIAHEEGLYDLEAIAFDHAFVTRGMEGQLKVWRMRENRAIALAAQSPMRCLRGLSHVLVAARAPVIACSTAEGLARWDLHEPDRFDADAFGGRALDLSPDGKWIVAARQHKLLLWRAGDKRYEVELARTAPAVLARFSPRDEVVAIVDPTSVTLFDLSRDPPARLMEQATLAHGVSEPTDARFLGTGLDFAVCDPEGEGRSIHLRRGRPAELESTDSDQPCISEDARPRSLRGVRDYGEAVLSAHSLGPRVFDGGWKRQDGTVVSRDLVAFEANDRRLGELIRFRDHSDTKEADGASVAAVVRDGDEVVWQVGGDIRGFSLDGKERWHARGNLLGRCPDGVLLAWRKAAEDRWELFDSKRDKLVRTIARAPGFVLGAEPSCQRVFFQWLDGRIASAAIAGGPSEFVLPGPVDPGGGGYVIDGYVFDVRPSAGGLRRAAGGLEEVLAPGLWFAFSSGAMVRADATGALSSYGHASPRATTMADGVVPGELIFADETGLVARRRAEQDRQLLAPELDREWSDVRVLPRAKHALVSSAMTVAAVDLDRAEIVGQTELPGGGRLVPWDREGSLLVWAYSFMGPAQGDIIPVGRGLAGKIGAAASNLVADLGTDGRTVVRLR